MNSQRLKELLEKIPLGPFVAAVLLYFAYEFYTFTSDESSPLLQARAQIENERQEVEKLTRKVKEAQDFLRSLEARKQRLRELAQKIEDMKSTLSEEIDVGEFLRMATTEARKVGLQVQELKPGKKEDKEFYSEQLFEMGFRGVYSQLAVFLERMANAQKIVRVDTFTMKPVGSDAARYVLLSGKVELKVYKYRATQADQVGKGGGAPANGGGKPPAPHGAKGAGA